MLVAVKTPTLLIRPLYIEEIYLCVPYGYQFHKEKQVPGEFNPEVFMKNWEQFILSGIGCIVGLWKDGVLIGGLGGVVMPDITTGQIVANEFFWFVQEGDRKGSWPIRLANAYFIWAKEKGAVRRRMVHILMPNENPSTVRLAHVYRKWNMRPIEVVYDGEL